RVRSQPCPPLVRRGVSYVRRASGGRVSEVHLPPQEVPRLVEDLLTVLAIGDVARFLPVLEERIESLSLRGVDRAQRPLVRHERVGCAVEVERGGVARRDGA